MIVVDASAMIEWMTDAAGRSDDVSTLLARDAHWVTTEHLLVEAMSALSGLWLGGRLDDAEFDELVRRLASYEFDVWPTRPLLPRIRELAHNAAAYDAAYIALAEEVGAPLLTTDAKLAAVPGIRCAIVGP